MQFQGFDWDSGNLAKCSKHGVSVAEIEFILETAVMVSGDSAHSMHEQRFIAVGAGPGGRVTFVAFTVRRAGDARILRPVSARYMHEKEFRRYVEKDRDRRSGDDDGRRG